MTAFVFDANVINIFQNERVRGEEGDAHLAIGYATSQGHLALDADGHCQQEWTDCAGGSPPLELADWIADMLQREKIHLYRFKCDNMFKELSGIGLPKKDHKWVRIARSSNSDHIVTEDIDLFDPTEKGCSSERAIQIKQSGNGVCAKYLRKKYEIEVRCLENFVKIID